MAYCNQCGTALPAGARFCSECGTGAGSGAGADSGSGEGPTVPVGAAASIRTPSFGAAAPPYPGLAVAHGNAPPPYGTAPYPAQPHGGHPPYAPVPATNPAIWILPIIAVITVLAVAYLWLSRRVDDGTPAQRTATAADGSSTRGEADAPARAVDQAEDAAATAVANTRGDTTFVSAVALDSAFVSDPAGTALRYSGPVTVTGVIASMVQPGATPSLSMEGRNRFNYMIVQFPTSYRTRLAVLSKGQTITVTCDSARSLGGTTILSDCLLP